MEQGRKKPRGRPFCKGDDPRRRQNRVPAGSAAEPVPEVPEPADEVNDGAPPTLKAARWAVRNYGRACPGTALEELLRQQLEDGGLKFTLEFLKLDREFKAGADGRPHAAGAVSAERVAGLEAENAALKARIEDLTRPVESCSRLIEMGEQWLAEHADRPGRG